MLVIDVSVIVPTHNRSCLLPGLFAGLAGQAFPTQLWELVVVNDGSADDTPTVLKRLATTFPVKVTIINQAHCGGAAARNAGAARAAGRVLIFIDDDMIVTPSLIAAHVRAHHSQSTAVVGQMSVPSVRSEPWTLWEDSQLVAHSTMMASRGYVLGPRDFYSGNCSISADLFHRVRGFNAALARTYDFELGYRLKAAGATLLYCAEAKSVHIGTHTFEKWLANAQTLGKSELVLGWDLGHVELQQKLFEWYRARHALIRWLVRLCSRRPSLEGPLVAIIHQVGGLSYRVGAESISKAAYSAIFNLAYWMRIVSALGADSFLHHVSRTKIHGRGNR